MGSTPPIEASRTLQAPSDVELRRAIADGDETAFARFVAHQHPVLVRFARSLGTCEQSVPQAAWQEFVTTLSDAAPSLRSALYRSFIARWRLVSGVSFGIAEEPAVPSERFMPSDHRWSGGWIVPPARFPNLDERARAALQSAIGVLPPAMRAVLLLRDGEGLSTTEIVWALDCEARSVRSLLHTARSRVRAALEAHFQSGGAS